MKISPPNIPNNLKAGTAHVWIADLIAIEHAYDAYFELLSKDEKNCASTFKFQKHRNIYVLSRGILRLLSGYYLGKTPKEIVFEYGDFGKPKFAFSSKLQFNISHAGKKAVFAFTRGYNIGADIELIKSDLDVLDLAHHFFSSREYEDLKSLHWSEQRIAFYRCWTRKEAFIKAKGTGLSFPLQSFSVSLNADLDVELLETKWDPLELSKWKLFSFRPSNDYLSAIAIHGKVNRVLLRNWDETDVANFVTGTSHDYKA